MQQSVSSERSMSKCTLKVFEQLGKVSNTVPNTKILGRVVSQDSHALSLLR